MFYEAEQFEFPFQRNKLKNSPEKVYNNGNMSCCLTNEEVDIIKTLALFDGIDTAINCLFFMRYIDDLNTLQRIENKLNERQWYSYVIHLIGYLPEKGTLDLNFMKKLISQNATNKCAALWKTLRKPQT